MRFVLALVLGLAAMGAAAAQVATDPRCERMTDKVGCSCALATGGSISGSTWSKGRGEDRDAFNRCMADNGRAPVRVQQIPRRL